jgi:hypothetical protein
MNLEELRSRIQGTITTLTDTGYEDCRRTLVWNEIKPARYPQLIVQVANEEDVVETIRFSRVNRLKVAIRGGGHNWVGFSLRDGSVLIDLGQLNQISIDAETRRATAQPAITGCQFNEKLAVHGLAFPVGHCPTVPLSGFLLNGGLGWNFNAWGPSCFSIEAANVVTADGNLAVANDEQNSDLLWAIRGGGPSFCGVVTQFVLKLFPVPRAIATSNYYYPLQRIDEVGAWAASIAGQLPKEVELTIFLAPAPPPLAEACRVSNGFVGILSATAFANNENETAATLGILESCPVPNEGLLRDANLSTPLNALLDLGGMLWPEGHRYLADTLWSDAPPAQQLSTLRDCFLRAPSPKAVAVLAFPTGTNSMPPPLDAAFSMMGRTPLLCYAIWERAEDDNANAARHRETVAALDRFAAGHYVLRRFLLRSRGAIRGRATAAPLRKANTTGTKLRASIRNSKR